ncbi:MAG TPA: CBS domain-containing protein [Thermoanaerobaculia bacterium]
MKELRVRDLMSDHVISVHPGDSVDKVYDAMTERGIRHIAVIDGEGDLVGLISHRDLLRHALIERSDLPFFIQRAVLRRTLTEEVMTSEVETAEPDLPLQEAARIMLENKFGCLPVVEGWRLVGILTESDFVKHFTRLANDNGRPS